MMPIKIRMGRLIMRNGSTWVRVLGVRLRSLLTVDAVEQIKKRIPMAEDHVSQVSYAGLRLCVTR